MNTRPIGVAAFRPAVEDDGEAESIAGVASLRRASFAQLYEDSFAFVWRSARRLGCPDADVDDVVQEIFVVAHLRLADFEQRSSVKTWLFGIVLNVVRNHRRKLRTKNPHALNSALRADTDALVDGRRGPDESASRAEAARLVDHLLEELDDDKREVFVLAELEEMTVPEIAAAMRVPLNTAYSRLRIARQEFAAAAARHRAREDARGAWRNR